MPKEVILDLSPRQAASPEFYLPIAYRKAGMNGDKCRAEIIKRSVDARKKNIRIVMTLMVYDSNESVLELGPPDYRDVSRGPEVIVVGSGPAGLFAALRLITLGLKPVILERGKDVSARKKDIAGINRNCPVDGESNYAFGEGGAGTFSDGKLYTRSKKRGDHSAVLRTLVYHGAPREILYETHPHIGTDKLPAVIKNIRQTILDCGGEVHFGTRVTDIILDNGCVAGVRAGGMDRRSSAVILATGHSARDVYEMLVREGIAVEAKPYAMGVRVEHPQSLIDCIQYHGSERGEYLPAASYTLTTQARGRGVYSFCMCPGGFIVPAMTAGDEIVVNGMSSSARNSPFANSGIVTEVGIDDYKHLFPKYGELAGIEFQKEFERCAKNAGGPENQAPGQGLADFVYGCGTGSLPESSYVPGTIPGNFKQWMPPFIYGSLREGFLHFERKMKGFITEQALVLGVESRTSSPVRIPRDKETMEHIALPGLFPAGEGAGYAGGILSAAMDGEKAAEAASRKFH